jgi:hydrophobic/amphiphilic exporter-1 (mainly G- bacteria), HAE1 family
MRLPDLAVKRPIAVLMLVGVVLLLGVVSFTSLPLDLFPDMQFPVAVIITDYSGAAPLEVENMVTRPLEGALGLVQNIQSLSSTSSPGNSLILMQFNWGTDMNFALLEVRERIDMVRGFLPEGVSSPLVMKADPSMLPVVQLEVAGDESMEEILRLAETIIKPRLERQEGVAMVSLGGGGRQEVAITLDPYLLGHYGVSMDQVAQVVAYENINLAAGSLVEGDKNYQVRAIGEYRDLDEIRNLVIPTQRGVFYLRDLGRVEERTMAAGVNRFNGSRSISITVNKQSDANTVMVSRRVQDALGELENVLPVNIRINKVMDQADYIGESIRNVAEIGLVGALLAVAVLFLFLRNLRSTFIITLAIPVSVVATFVLMFFNGMTMNLVTLGGVALGLGIMVDNSIVVLENIYRMRLLGIPREEAAPEGTNQVAGAIIAATLTTVVVFLPVVFVEGIASQIFAPLAVVVTFALMTSLLVSLTVVPMLSSRFLTDASLPAEASPLPKTPEDTPRRQDYFSRIYGKVEGFYAAALSWSLRHRAVVVTALILSFGLSLLLIPSVGREFLPYMDEGYLSVRVQLPVGASEEETEKIAIQVEEYLLQVPEVAGVSLSIGGGGSGMRSGMGGGSNLARLEVILADLNKRSLSSKELAEQLRLELRNIAGAEISVRDSGQMGGMLMGGTPLSLAIRGDDLAELELIATEMASLIRTIPGAREIETSFDEGRPEIQVRVERDVAASYGFSGIQAANLLRTALTGQRVARLRTGGQERDIILTLPPETADSLAALQQLPLLSPLGGLVPLGEIARFEEAMGPTSIRRYDQVRTASITGEVSGRDIGSVMDDIKILAADYPLPEGYYFDFEGEQRLMEDAFDSLYLALALAVVLVYMIMAAQFESLLHPLIIMFAIPQTVTGVLVSLYLTGRSLSTVSFIGIIMLAGIVVNNGIVLIDYVNLLRRQGLPCREALLQAGPVRLRPILMTTLTTILAMFPLSLGLGSGAEMQAPLATVVIGGLLFSTVLTLVVVPVVYSLSEDATLWFSARRSPALAGSAKPAGGGKI